MQISCRLFPTIITPYDHEQNIDYSSLGRLIDFMFSNQVDGLFAVCQSSEMFWLTDDEKLRLASFCIDRCRVAGKACVVSGHTQDALDDQIAYLQRLEALAPDAIILVTNRLAQEDESDDQLIARLAQILGALQPDTRLGLYECPHPYKRLLTEPVLRFVRDSGRFDFIKDTSCQIDRIRQRLCLLEGSGVQLYNANAATLWESLLSGAAGYSGVMLNFMPDVFWLLKRYLGVADPAACPTHLPCDRRSAQSIASFIALASVYEYQNYPANAKIYLQHKGLIAHPVTRSGSHQSITESQRKELIALANHVERVTARADLVSCRERVFSPDPRIPSCHASTLVALADGTVLLAFFGGAAEGQDDVGIWLARKIAGSWLPPVCIAKSEPLPHWNPVLFETREGIRLVYKVGRRIADWQSYTMRTGDLGVTWSAPQKMPDLNPAGGPVRSKPIRLASGLLLAPNSDETADAWRPRVDVSDDEGQSFRRFGDIPLNTSDPGQPDYLAGKGAIQPTLWESQPGQIHALLRTADGFIFRSDSEDAGLTWCTAYNTHLPSNNSAIEIAQDGSMLYLILNPITGNWADRSPLVIWRSDDNGRTFKRFVTLENAETNPLTQASAEFSYPSAVVRDHVLHVAYTYHRQQMAYCRIELKKPAES